MSQSNDALARSALLEVALDAARAGATVVAAAAPRAQALAWHTKKRADFVSEVDLASEAAIIGVIQAKAPGASILAEERGAVAAREHAPTGAGAQNAIRFVVDPLDGTTNFLHGYPEYAVSIGVLDSAGLVAGVVIDVALGEVFTATRGGGAFSNGKPIRVASIEDPERALVGTGFPFTRAEQIEPYLTGLARVMAGAAGVRRAGAAALDLASVAAGRFEAFWEAALSPWDIAAGILLVREAGGVATDLAGAPCEVKHTGIVAGNPAIHQWLMDQVRGH